MCCEKRKTTLFYERHKNLSIPSVERAGGLAWCLGSKKPSWGWHFFWGSTNVRGKTVNPRVILVNLFMDFHTQPFRWVQKNLGDSDNWEN
jgi:hypothetical protein